MNYPAFTEITLHGALPLVAKGKVRDLHEINANTLLLIATDHISAFDVVLANGIPSKGRILADLTRHWFSVLKVLNPGLKTHFLSMELPSAIRNPQLKEQLRGRSMQVRKLRMLPIEAIVRGYLSGSAWQEYQDSKTVRGQSFDRELQESEAFPDGPIYTPSTKAPLGEKDKNITREQAGEIIGHQYAARVEELSLKLYTAAAAYAAERGVIIADTKFEFGIDSNDEVIIADEVLTPDSSRFWDKQSYTVGCSQESFDKQPLRDWLLANGMQGKEDVKMPADIVEDTSKRYQDAYRRLTGVRFER